MKPIVVGVSYGSVMLLPNLIKFNNIFAAILLNCPFDPPSVAKHL